MSPQAAAFLLVPLMALGQNAASASGVPSAQQIEQAVRQLGDDDFGVRQRASLFLWQAGTVVEGALKKATTSEDVEVVARARRILRDFRYGIFSDTPKEALPLIHQFRLGNHADRQTALRKLMEMGETDRMRMLLRTESSEELRRKLTSAILKDLDKVVGGLFIAGHHSQAEQLLELGAASTAGMRDYAAYWLLRDGIDAKLAEIDRRAANAPELIDARLRSYLLRAKGDLAGASQAATKASDPALTGGILVELGNWEELARWYDSADENPEKHAPGGIVQLGYTAAYHRLAGNTEKFADAVAAIRRLAAVKPTKVRYCAEALVINDRFQDAIDLLGERDKPVAFRLLCAQSQLHEAFQLGGIDGRQGPGADWLSEPQANSLPARWQKRTRFDLGILVGVALYGLGEEEQATGLFGQLERAAVADKSLSLRQLCEAECQLGLADQAQQHGAAVLATQWKTSVLQSLFPEFGDAAEMWWKFFCLKYPGEPRRATIDRVRRMVLPVSPPETSPEDRLALLEEAQRTFQQSNETDRSKWLWALGETCMVWGRHALAQRAFEQAAAFAPSVLLLTRLGDLAARQQRWQRAAEWYGQAWELDRAKPTALYLQGRALVRAGREVEGQRRIEAARLLPLANDQTRCDFAEDLYQRGFVEAARGQWQVVLSTGEFLSLSLCRAADRLAEMALEDDPLTAASYWQRFLLRYLRTSSPLLGIDDHLRCVSRIHKARARGLLAVGRIDEALAEVWSSHAAMPGDVDLACDVVPQLDRLAHRSAADELFAKVYAVNERVCQRFPRSAVHHAHLARLALRCDRRTDEALQHANRAVELAPQNADHVGVLAELYFDHGDRQRAIELAQRCVELAPQQTSFQEQLRRFQTP